MKDYLQGLVIIFGGIIALTILGVLWALLVFFFTKAEEEHKVCKPIAGSIIFIAWLVILGFGAFATYYELRYLYRNDLIIFWIVAVSLFLVFTKWVAEGGLSRLGADNPPAD